MPNYLVAGMAFGDEGKGSIVDALVRRVGSDLVVRYNGGAQAAHNVITSDGRHHTFAQFGAGTFVPGVRTYLSRFVLINPVSMMIEEEALRKQGVTDAWSRMLVDGKCLVITPFQKAYNRLTEIKRDSGRHGSTGMGIGQCRADSLLWGNLSLVAGDLFNNQVLQHKLEWQQKLYKRRLSKTDWPTTSNARREIDAINSDSIISYYMERYKEWRECVNIVYELPLHYTNPVFEGAQGVLLDETHGFQPHTTWTDCTFANAETILNEVGNFDQRYRIGVWRTYFTRHGAGPMPSEASAMKQKDNEKHNKTEAYTGAFRVGSFDLPLALYANHIVGGLDGFVVNHFDEFPHIGIPVRLAHHKTIHLNRIELIEHLEAVLRAPLLGQGDGPTSEDKSIDLKGMIDHHNRRNESLFPNDHLKGLLCRG